MLKNPGELTAEENQILEYAKIVLGEDEYKKIKETIFTYEDARKYIKCNVLGIDVGFKTYFPNEISNLPKQIVYLMTTHSNTPIFFKVGVKSGYVPG